MVVDSDAGVWQASGRCGTTPKKTKAAAAASKKPRTKPAHPPTSDMVNAAIGNLKERGGSSLQAIKKYITANYKVDAEKLAPFIRMYLKSAVAAGTLTQPKGKGASGSFKLSVKGEGKSPAAPAKKTKAPTKPKAEKKPKAAAPKKAAVAKKPASAKKAAKPKSPSKAKKVTKPPTKKPKSPKPKKAAVKKPKTPKKTAAKKR